MEFHSSGLENTIRGFVWANLPLDISYLILDALEWPSHSVCRRVCHSWRTYFDQPRLVTKRYNSPIIAKRAIHKIRELDGTVTTNIFELPGQAEVSLKQIHRILTGPVLAFFLYRGPETRVVDFGKYCYFAPEERAFYRSRVRKAESTDLRGYFPDAIVGKITNMMFNPEYDEVDSGSEREGIEEYTPLPIGPWALRLNHIPFADEAVVSESSLPVKFEPRFASLTDPQIFVLVREYLREHINKLSRSPTVSELVIGIIRVIARYFRDKEHSYLDGMGVFISFRGVMNDQHSSPGFLPIEMSVESACAWIERGDEEEKDYEEEGTKRQQAKRQKTMKKRTATNRLA